MPNISNTHKIEADIHEVYKFFYLKKEKTFSIFTFFISIIGTQTI